METKGKGPLDLVHDLAMLYLALAHGADQHFDRDEQTTLSFKLRQWLPDKDPALIDHVIRDAWLDYMNGLSEDEIGHVVDELTEILPHTSRLAVLLDLVDIARADSVVRQQEKDFVSRIANSWEVDVRQLFVS